MNVLHLTQLAALLTVDANGMAPLQGLLQVHNTELLYPDIHVFFAAAKQNQKWFELFRQYSITFTSIHLRSYAPLRSIPR